MQTHGHAQNGVRGAELETELLSDKYMRKLVNENERNMNTGD